MTIPKYGQRKKNVEKGLTLNKIEENKDEEEGEADKAPVDQIKPKD